MLGSIKFLTWSIKRKTSYCILYSLKLTTLYLICNCQISSISVFFLYFKLLYCLDIFAALLQFTRLFQYLGNVYLIFNLFSGMLGQNRSLKSIHVTCHSKETPLNEMLVKSRLVKIVLKKIDVVFFYCFKTWSQLFSIDLVKVLICGQMDWIHWYTIRRK